METPLIQTSTQKQTTVEAINTLASLVSEAPLSNHGLLTGSAGCAIFLYHAAQYLNAPALSDRAYNMVENMFDDLNNNGQGFTGSSYSIGAGGFCYTINYLAEKGFLDIDPQTELSDLDDHLYTYALKQIQVDKIDFLYGSLGVVHYFASRRQTEKINSYLNGLVIAICNRIQSFKADAWFRNLGLNRLKSNEVDLGLAHGQCGILLILLEVFPLLKEQQPVKTIINAVISLIQKCQLPDDFDVNICSLFPNSFFIIDTKAENFSINNRLAWCYGDLNQVLLLYRAGRILDNPAYLKLAHEIGHKAAARRTEAATQLEGTMICHGTSGLAQFYRTLFQESKDPVYSEEYQYWIEISANTAVQEANTSGQLGLLQGTAGVGMALLDSLSGAPGDWNNIFLL